MTAHHNFQRAICDRFAGPILNAASKEDPAHLGDRFGATNLDIVTQDAFTKAILPNVCKNFVCGNVYDLADIFGPKHFGLIVLGEFLEHCVPGAALRALQACRVVLKDDGRVCVTFPLDERAPDLQHAKDLLFTVIEGETGHDIVSFHQTCWRDEMLVTLCLHAGFVIEERTEVHYGFVGDKSPQGWGLVLRKTEDDDG